nr:MAG: hypothetical protein DIU78_05230 [Pseudomonadota bacterium]
MGGAGATTRSDMPWRAPLTLAILGSLCACERKAPGPKECLQFANRVTGVTHPAQLEIPAVREQVDDLTRRCLTTPYDRELLRCFEVTGRFHACQLAFEYRRRLK